MTKIYAIIIHGIGKAKPGYALGLIKGLKKRFNRHIRKVLKTNDDYADELVVKEIVWDDILADQQERLAKILKKTFIQESPGGIRAFFRVILHPVSKKIWGLRTDFTAESISDIIGYGNREAYQEIHKRLCDEINALNESDQKQYLSVIAHSLGTVISSDFIYDQQRKNRTLHQNFVFSNFFTLGSPIALFALRYGVELFQNPIHMEDAGGRWINIFDIDDPIAYPLKHLNDAYDKAVHIDYHVNTGVFGVSHTKYFENKKVQETIAAKLAEDWVRLNQKTAG